MSTAKENPCRKFQANIFNKSKCQNCFKPRELHLLTDQDLTQAKPIYGGWLCLAPEGTDFDNPMQRSRKWQRRFFVLYEHGCLRFALDESPSTLPQGTVNMNVCMDVIDAEPKTGQKNALCIITPEQEWSDQLVVYPRTNKQNQKKKRKVEPATSLEPGPAKVAVPGSGIPEADKVPDSSSIIWQEELSQREVEGATVWSAADLSPLGSLPPPAGDAASVGSDAGSLNGDEVDRAAAAPLLGSVLPPGCGGVGDPLSPTGSCSSLGGVPRCLSPAPSDPFPSGSSLLSNGSHISGSLSSLDSDASGSTVTSNDSHPAAQRGGPATGYAGLHHDTPRARRLEAEARKAEKRSRLRSPDHHQHHHQRPPVLSPERSRSGVIEKLEALELENAEKMEVEEEVEHGGARQGRSEHRRFHRQETGQDLDFTSTRPPLRRAKSLDRRTTESVMTPDLLNFKKGWMVKLEENGQWKKYWFVLTDHSLRYYKDSIAEEASDMDGEIELSTCYSVTEYQAQRNYGFQIHTQEGVHTLSAMTAGIRRNWIQAVMKNVRPSTAPDVASSTEDHGVFAPLESLARPDVTQDSPSSEASSVEREAAPGLKKSRARDRRREGRSKTFDCAEFQAIAKLRAQEAESLSLGELERSRRREERRKRYDAPAGPPPPPSEGNPPSAEEDECGGGRMDYESGEAEAVRAGPEAAGGSPLERQQRVEEVIEQHWQQVEKTPLREEKRVPLPVATQPRDTSDLEKLLESYKKGVEDLKSQLEGCHQQLVDSSQHKQELELQLRTALEREHDVRSGYISPEVVKAGEMLRLHSEENVKEIDSLTVCMENLKKKHEVERTVLVAKFDGEMDELRSVVTPLGPASDGGPTDGSTGILASPAALSQTLNLKERLQDLVTQVSAMTGEMRRREQQGDATALRMKYEKDLENLKATCERGFAAMEDSHQKVIDELQRKHQRELENLQEEKERLLAEETAATIAAIEAMRNAHRSELERELEKARKANHHELCSFQREIEVLSEQYSQKCLENAHLAQALEAERQALRQCQRENQELNAHNQITKMRSMATEDGDSGVTIQGKELYELEVMLRVKESEVQYLKQEINSLKDELQAAQRDIYTELSIVKAKAERDLGRLRDQLQMAHQALGSPRWRSRSKGGYGSTKSMLMNPSIQHDPSLLASWDNRVLLRVGVGSLKEGLTAEQRLHLFDNKDTKEF
ncbi:hypothetical protein CRUP_001610 [Coryphaenoides rupestris]|nr:hypothetical protein CRUP_001610 [Coryphaenoides rupestris]